MVVALVALSQAQQTPYVAEIEGRDAGLRVAQLGATLAPEFYVKDATGKTVAAAIDASLVFESAKASGRTLTLVGKQFTAVVQAPEEGGVFSVAVSAKATAASLRDALFSVTLVPNGASVHNSDLTSPAGRGIVPHDRLATPFAMLSARGLSVAMMPDVQDLESNRPMPSAMVVETTRLAYGFLPYSRGGDWSATRTEGVLKNPAEFEWRAQVLVARTPDAVDEANTFLWARDGAQRARAPFPQTVPFRYYTLPTYELEARGGPGLWWIAPGEDAQMRAPRGADGQAKFTVDENIVRFAYGLRWWGVELQQTPWIRNADEVINFVLTAPRRERMSTIAYDTATSSWRFEPFDASAAAQTARYLHKYANDFDHAREAEINAMVARLANDLLNEAKPNGLTALFFQEFAAPRATDYLQKHGTHLAELARRYTGDRPSPESVALALYLSRTNPPGEPAKSLVKAMFLHQALWKPTTVLGTEVFGAFSGEHFLEERQSVYTADLFETVARLGLRGYAGRAVAALRAPLALFAHSTHGISGQRYPEGLSAYRSVAWFGDRGQGVFGPWQGFAEGVGQTLTSLGEVTDQYGSYYTHKDGWTVGIDGLMVENGKIYSAFAFNPMTFEGVFPFEHVDASVDERTAGQDPDNYPTIRAMKLELDGEKMNLVALPGFTAVGVADRLKGSFTFGDGSTKPAQFLPTGLGTVVEPADLAKGPVAFYGSFDSTPLLTPKTYLLAAPPTAAQAWPFGWLRTLGLADVVRTSVSYEGRPIVSTADNGKGERVESLTGAVESQAFLVTKNSLSFTLVGSADPDCYVELLDSTLGVPLMSLQKQGDSAEEYTWQIYDLVGRMVSFRLVDKSKVGSIEVKDLKAAAIDPD